MSNNPIYRYDDTNAFSRNFIEIHAEFPDDTWADRVSKAEFKVANLPVMTFEDPVFPITINLSSEQTALLKDTNNCYLAVYDENGLKVTCEGTLTFDSHRRVV